jgi:hypothetical protein
MKLPRRREESGRVRGTVLVLALLAGAVGYALWSQSKPMAMAGLPDESAVADACAKHGYFQAAAAYDGPGPHPVKIAITKKNGVDPDAYTHLTVVTIGPQQLPPALENPGESVQLIACLERSGLGRQVETCYFNASKLPMYAATYDVTVYEARTGADVGATTLVDAELAVCPSMVLSKGGNARLFTEPSARQIDKVLKDFTS